MIVVNKCIYRDVQTLGSQIMMSSCLTDDGGGSGYGMQGLKHTKLIF